MPIPMRSTVKRTWPAGLDQRAALPEGRTHVSLNTRRAEVAAVSIAHAVRDAERLLREAQSAISSMRRMEIPWSRACWICGAHAMCDHREHELIEHPQELRKHYQALAAESEKGKDAGR